MSLTRTGWRLIRNESPARGRADGWAPLTAGPFCTLSCALSRAPFRADGGQDLDGGAWVRPVGGVDRRRGGRHGQRQLVPVRVLEEGARLGRLLTGLGRALAVSRPRHRGARQRRRGRRVAWARLGCLGCLGGADADRVDPPDHVGRAVLVRARGTEIDGMEVVPDAPARVLRQVVDRPVHGYAHRISVECHGFLARLKRLYRIGCRFQASGYGDGLQTGSRYHSSGHEPGDENG